MNKKKIWLKIGVAFIFITICSVSFVLLSYLMRPITTSRKNICGFYAEEKNSLDVVFVGGSVCYTSWEPLRAWNEWGFTSYNFAIDAMQPQVIKYALEEIKKTQSPELYVIDLRPFQYGDVVGKQDTEINMERVAPFRNFVDNIKYSSNRFWAIENGAPKLEEKWTYHFDIAKYHSGISTFLNIQNWQYIFNEKSLYTKGFEGYAEAIEFEPFDVRGVTDSMQLGVELNLIFEDLLEYCSQTEMRVLFLVYGYGSSPEDQQKYNYMKTLITDKGFDYLNMNEYLYEMQLDFMTDYHDADHVTVLGADKYTNFLGVYLTENYDLPDKREDVAYMQWNKDYLRWNSEMEVLRDNLEIANGKD